MALYSTEQYDREGRGERPLIVSQVMKNTFDACSAKMLRGPVFSRSILERRKDDVFPVSFLSAEREGTDKHVPEMCLTLEAGNERTRQSMRSICNDEGNGNENVTNLHI